MMRDIVVFGIIVLNGDCNEVGMDGIIAGKGVWVKELVEKE
jgi:hypothetical protein